MGQLSVSMLDTLNSLYRHELTNHLIYLRFRAWASYRGLSGAEKWFSGQATGEAEHAEKVFSYILSRNETAEPSPFSYSASDIPSYKSMFDQALEVERGTTAVWSACYAQAMQEADFLTAQWIMDADGLMKEQISEENEAQTNVDRITILSEGGELTGEQIHHFDVLLLSGFPK